MTPARGDHDARRIEVSEAVWRVLAERGFGGLTLRAVAAEMRATTGLLTHYFPNKRALVAYALDVLERRSADRPRPAVAAAVAAVSGASGASGAAEVSERAAAEAAGTAADGVPALAMLRAVLLDILPLSPDSRASNRIWVGSWDVALADPELAAEHAERYRRSRRRIAELVAEAQRHGELARKPPAEEVAAAAQSYVLGLVVQALLAPQEFSSERQTALLDAYLGALRTDGGGSA